MTSDVMMRMDPSSTQIIGSMHLDYVNEVAFSPYGRRLATCSGDRFVRVFDLTDSGEWTLSAQWQAHRGAVTCIGWAHPEFGALLATAGSDHEAKLWEERHGNNTTTTQQQQTATTTTTNNNSRWTQKASLTEARRAVTCLEFSPRHWGLKLAVGSSDGSVRVYEAVDIMNLAQWPLTAALSCFADEHRVTSVSWCNGRFEPPTFVVGGKHLIVYRYVESSRAWQPLLQLPAPTKGQVLDVAWAPNVGRRFHYIASAENQQLRVYTLFRQTVTDSDTGGGSSGGGSSAKKQQYQLTLASSQTIEANAWRCQWNVTGTVLASSGDAGVVQLWKPSGASGDFVCVSRVQGDLSQVSAIAPTATENM